jgi:thymidylate synthase
MNSYGNFTHAYVDLCRQIRDESEFISAPRGMKIKEKLGVPFRIKNPRDRLPYIEARNFSLSYFVA